MEFREVVQKRRAVKKFDPGHAISDAELKHIFGQVALAPSSFNIQHTRFVVVRDKRTKAALRQAAFNQEQVETASATVAVVGKLNAHEDAAEIYQETPASVREVMLPMIRGFYEGKPQMQRDEAIRSAALSAMTLMLAAQDAGYASGPMIGFDQEEVSKVLGLDRNHIPVMLVVIGKPVGEQRARPFRYPLEATVKLDSWSGPGLR